MKVEFLVTSADSGEPIRNARIEVQTHGGFYDGGWQGEDPFELRTDGAGVGSRQLTNNRCIGSVSRLRFTDTCIVYVPMWRVRALATGYEPSEWVDVYEEYRGKVQRVDSDQNRLSIWLPLRKAARPVDRTDRPRE